MKGLKPSPIDWRDSRFHFERHFGATTVFPDNYNADIGQWMPDQDADNRPSECTGYLCADMCANEDGIRYSEDFNFMQTLELMDEAPNADGADLRQAAKVPCTIGLLPRDDEPAELFSKPQAWAANPSNWPSIPDEVYQRRRPARLPVYPTSQDWFDTVRSALITGAEEKREVGIGTRWSPDFETNIMAGVLPENPKNLQWGHAYAICGWKKRGDLTFLIAKTWQGGEYGDSGYCYLSRTLFNRLMSDWGTYAFVYEKLPTGSVEELKSQIMTLSEVIAALLAYLQNHVYGFIELVKGLSAGKTNR